MKKLLILALVATATTAAWAAQPLCPTAKGQTLLYANKNAKEKVQNYTRQTVTEVEGSGANLTITYEAESLDGKKRSLSETPILVPFTLKVEGGAVVYDVKSLLGGIVAGLQTGEASGEPLVLPANLKSGDALPDASVKMQILFMKIDLKYTEGKCTAEEERTTPAGTFKCLRVEQKCSGRALAAVEMKTVTWYAPGIGIVRQETYNKDKLQTVIELEESK
jgi:hypothetical protein